MSHVNLSKINECGKNEFILYQEKVKAVVVAERMFNQGEKGDS